MSLVLTWRSESESALLREHTQIAELAVEAAKPGKSKALEFYEQYTSTVKKP
jgi:hypothetical protein